MKVRTLALVLAGIPVGWTAGADPDWHFPASPERALVRLESPAAGEPVDRPVEIALPADLGGAFRAWDLQESCEVPAQRDGGRLLLAPPTPLAANRSRVLLVYRGGAAGVPSQPGATMSADGRLETGGYLAKIDPGKGGVLRSLACKVDGRLVETLGGAGIRWWMGRTPQVTPESFGEINGETVAAGPVFTAVRFRYPKVLAEANSVVVDYRFFRDFVEMDFRYEVKTPVEVLWLKLPVTLRSTGGVPGFLGNSGLRDSPLLTSGPKSRWIPDATWTDVTYAGAEPFGLGVIGREVPGGLFFMDSVNPSENEWIYAEPLGWKTPVAVKDNIDLRFTIVLHGGGREAWRKTLAKRESAVAARLSAWQKPGEPPLDSDGDGWPDLVEVEHGTNPLAADTDLDGTPDGADSEPLRGPAPERKLHWPDFKAQPTEQPQSVAEIRPVGGAPALVIDGKPYGPMTYTRCAGSLPQIAEIADRRFPVHFEMVGSVGWPGRQQKTFEGLDAQIRRFLKEAPNARIVLRLYVCNPRDFAREYPNELLRFNDGSTQHFTRWYAEMNFPPEDRGYPSFASEIWRQNTAQALWNYVTHVRQADYARNIIGYFVCGGGTEEWYYWGDYDHARYGLDFSAPMLSAFRDHLRRKYGGDVARLRAAWHDRRADFATAMPPDPAMRRVSSGAFWPEEVRNRVRDYYEVHNKAMEDAVLIFARAVKQACDRQQLVGIFHGYLQNHSLLEGGQATLHDVLDSPDIDFWSGPPQYDRRGPGEHGCVRFLMASLKQHGKLWISESDIRTSFSEASPQNPALYGRPPDVAESLACLKREFAHQLCEGGNGWWFQMGAQWYHHPPVLDLFERMQTVGEAAMGVDRSAETDIAAVVDLKSLSVGPGGPVTSSLIDAFKVQELCRLGSPVDHWELRDILAPGAKRYKLYLMLNCFSLDDEQRKQIDERLRRNGAVLVWMYAPGWFNPNHQPEEDPQHSAHLLGFPLRTEIAPAQGMNMKLTGEGAAYFQGFDPGRVFGSFERPRWEPDPQAGGVKAVVPGELTLTQRFYGEAPGQVLARFAAGGQPSIALRRTDRATDLWIGSVMAPADLLRAVARRAGCHLYCDGDEIVYANRSFLAIHTGRPGVRTFQLRRPSDVVEVFGGDVLARETSRFADSIEACRTRLYFLGSQAEWKAQMERADVFFARFLSELRTSRSP